MIQLIKEQSTCLLVCNFINPIDDDDYLVTGQSDYGLKEDSPQDMKVWLRSGWSVSATKYLLQLRMTSHLFAAFFISVQKLHNQSAENPCNLEGSRLSEVTDRRAANGKCDVPVTIVGASLLEMSPKTEC